MGRTCGTYGGEESSNDTNTKFLCMVLESSCIWKAHMFQLLPKSSKACYLMRVIKPIMSIETLRIVYKVVQIWPGLIVCKQVTVCPGHIWTTLYYSYFHSLMTYGLIFWGNSSYSLQIFRTQKRTIRIMCGLRPTDSCRKFWESCHYSLSIYFLYCFLS
jgi:hypothetical protein